MARSKRAYYAPHARELEGEDVVYQPMVWSCYGRPHVETAATLMQLSRAAARRQGFEAAGPLLARTQTVLGVQLWRRVASMVHACLPLPSADEAALTLGM